MRSTIVYSLFLVVGVTALALREWSISPDGSTHAYFFDVGQGDSTLLTSPSGKQVIIDGGRDLSLLEHLGRVMPFFDRTIELLVLSHPDFDHLAAFPAVLNRYDIGRVLLTGVEKDLGVYKTILETITRNRVPVTIASETADFGFDDGLRIDTLWPPLPLTQASIRKSDVNDTSIVLRAHHGNNSILLTGDITEQAEFEIIRRRIDIDADILKVAHHGSKTSSSEEFLRAASPTFAVISAGEENSYGHPHHTVLERLQRLEIPWRETKDGTIECSLDSFDLFNCAGPKT